MKTMKGNPKAYKILECLCHNQNSKIFKVLCIDNILGVSEIVVLKIIQSKNSFQDWIQEFESLKLVKSSRCVAIYNWERLEGSPALVLEYVEGLSLKELIADCYLKPMMADYIINEIHEGLLSLRSVGLSHGDLSPNNVMVDTSGAVKLIDYGMGNLCGRYTPSFTSPETLSRGEYSYFADLFSLGKLAELMGRKNQDTVNLTQYVPEKRRFTLQSQRKNAQVLVAKKVAEIRAQKLKVQTEVKKSPSSSFRMNWVAGILLAFTISSSEGQTVRIDDGEGKSFLSIRSQHWAEIRVNRKRLGYSPLFNKEVASGQLVLEWTSPKGSGARTLTVRPGEHKVVSVLD